MKKGIITNLNKSFDNRVRLGIMAVLVVNDWVEFKQLKEVLGVTDGNLASHITALEKKDLIEIRKMFVGKKPQTSYRVTMVGRKAFQEHLDALEALIHMKGS
jgi:DNA-binding MarR family transcriptional regulator